MPIGGEFNVMNSLAAATACARLGVDLGDDRRRPAPRRSSSRPLRGGRRRPAVRRDRRLRAHPDGLEKALGAARQAAGAGTVHVVFGCGGDRDREKRPLMGAVAATAADDVVITSDNPRSEDPLAIINATIEGVPPTTVAAL